MAFSLCISRFCRLARSKEAFWTWSFNCQGFVTALHTTTNNEIILDSETLGLADGEYVEEIRFVFENEVQKGFKNDGTKIITKANEDLKNNQIIENHTYLTADYLQTKLEDKDVFHTIIRIPEKTSLTGVLPRTGK